MGRPGQPYRPSNGSEGECFIDHWCGACTHDAVFRDDPDSGLGCQIVADTFVYDKGDPRYPKEWVYDRSGVPCCTAFAEMDELPRCDKTIDMMFDGKQPERDDGRN